MSRGRPPGMRTPGAQPTPAGRLSRMAAWGDSSGAQGARATRSARSRSPWAGRPTWPDALDRTGLMTNLIPFAPRIAGALPISLGLADSGVEILCHADDPNEIAEMLWRSYRLTQRFALSRAAQAPHATHCYFHAFGWAFHISGSALPVREQPAQRILDLEQRLLRFGAAALRHSVMEARRRGLSTEAAFASVLGLSGDPNTAVMGLCGLTDRQICALLADAGFVPPRP